MKGHPFLTTASTVPAATPGRVLTGLSTRSDSSHSKARDAARTCMAVDDCRRATPTAIHDVTSSAFGESFPMDDFST